MADIERTDHDDRKRPVELFLVSMLTGAAIILTFYAHFVLRTGTIFTHFFYIPILLAAYWFDRRGMAVPVLLALILLATDLWLNNTAWLIDDILRSLVFSSVAAVIVFLRVSAIKAERALEERSDQLEKANIQLKELDRLKSVFISSMSHELRTPLNSIIGFTSLLLQGLSGDLNEEQKKQLSTISRNSKHLLSLINDVIDVSKIEADKLELDLQYFDLTTVITESVETISAQAQKKNIRIAIDMPKTLPIFSDERRIRQILLNFLSNALKFTDSGRISVGAKSDPKFATVTVTDTGIGIKKEHMVLLFGAFSRIEEPGSPIREGTGLGLYLSRKLALLLGGKVTAQSQFGKGSEFSLSLPMKGPKPKKVVR